ncbi:thimet oligopeptidase [Nocardioides terrae]|uniref:Thimet oligopeptidase n=1 Tax=Nocardioides terrae TaxID=574651 RepID=A0A1I1N5A6_9ACTN|nr:M3 family metallopeptidase [Nocardioides terrae]SFC92516.1 thimet oligopeptidase [Nocardioides terrae]
MNPLDLPAADRTLAWIEERTRTGLSRARELADGLRGAPPADPVAALKVWDELSLVLGNVAAPASLLANVHPLEEVRTASEGAEVEVDRLVTELNQDRALYDVFAGLAVPEDPLAARLLERTLRDFRRAGVDRGDDVRARIKAIDERLTELGQEFSRIIRDDVRTVRVAPERLAGMPEDWLAAHPAGEDGLVTVSTDYPDSVPARMFVHDADVRRQVTVAFLERGWPHNDAVLREMLALRQERAGLVGHADWPSYDAEVKMIGSGPAIAAFIDKIADAADGPMRRDLDVVLERYREDVPGASSITSSDLGYYQELVRKEQLEVDSHLVRTYFDFSKVRQGLLDVTGRLFGLRYEPVECATWHDDVTSYDVFRIAGGEHLGRIHLDLHPRDGKYKHAAQFTLADGVLRDGSSHASSGTITQRQLPEGVLVCNFSRGLMEHDHVVTLFHEFGHLLHHVLGGQGEWVRFAGVATEWDFVEAPSQMLEEWAWDASVLRGFASTEAGEPIPSGLVERMRAADDFGKGIQARQQMFYAAMSYYFHAEQPEDLTARMVELQERYAPTSWVEGTHMFANFGHLGGYSSAYYTYMWSLVIAKDMFSAFDPADLFAPDVAGRYRDRVLARGGEEDAADLVADFLGRPFTFDSYAAWLAS